MSQCAECKRSRLVTMRVKRLWGGNYRSGTHHRFSYLCLQCAEEIEQSITLDTSQSSYRGGARWCVRSLLYALAQHRKDAPKPQPTNGA